MFFNNSFILASSSSSRYKILKKNNLKFLKIKPNCNEDYLKNKLVKMGLSAKTISLELARLKSKSISKKKPNKLVVGCDTIIYSEGLIVNKAKNTQDAKIKIKKLSGKKHKIYSSVSVFLDSYEVWKKTQTTTVEIRSLSEKEINKYISICDKSILNSVGCYQIESLGPNIIKNIKGDFFNVMGFPLFPFLNFLKKHKKPNA